MRKNKKQTSTRAVCLAFVMAAAMMLSMRQVETSALNDSSLVSVLDATGEDAVIKAASYSQKNAKKPEIFDHPESAVYTYGKKAAVLKVEAGSVDDGTLSYQWYKNSQNKNSGGTKLKGETSRTYRPDTTKTGKTYYYCVVTNKNSYAAGNQTASVTTKCCSIQVNPAANKITGVTSTITKTPSDGMFRLTPKAKGVIRFKSSDPKVVDINAKTGLVQIMGPGKAIITVNAGSDNYKKVSKKVKVTVKVPATQIKKIEDKGKGTITIHWIREKNASGYRIQYATNPKFNNCYTILVGNNAATSKTLKELEKNQKYYIRICCYNIKNQKGWLGSWSPVVTKTCRK